MRTLTVAIIAFLLSVSAAPAQGPAEWSAYNVDDAYQVYNAVIRRENPFQRAQGTIVIQQETVGAERIRLQPQRCLSDEAAETFKDAVTSFVRVNSYRWVLQRRFEVEKPYELVSENAIKAVFTPCCDFRKFYKKFPNSGGYIIFSAVGFNGDKTLAIVYSDSNWASGGGETSLHLLKKVDGSWTEVDGVRCFAIA